MSDVKNQHYVPQSYLKRFADHSDRLSVFDKFTRKSFQTHVKNIASETHFYDFHQDIQKDFQNQVASRLHIDSHSRVKRAQRKGFFEHGILRWCPGHTNRTGHDSDTFSG